MSELINQMINDLKLVLDITSRVDERVKIIVENQAGLAQRLNKFVDEHYELAIKVKMLETQAGAKLLEETRVEILETASLVNMKESVDGFDNNMCILTSRLEKLELSNNGFWDKAKHVGELFIQGIWVIVVCYILYKLGIQTPLP